MLQEMKCEYIINQSDPDFLDQLSELIKKLKANICFEAVAGNLTGQILNRMPYKSRLILYGMLSEQPVGEIDPLMIIGRDLVMETFFLGDWTKEKSLWALSGIVKKVQTLIRNKTFHSQVQKRISLYEVMDSIDDYKKTMTAGKYVIYPFQEKPTN